MISPVCSVSHLKHIYHLTFDRIDAPIKTQPFDMLCKRRKTIFELEIITQRTMFSSLPDQCTMMEQHSQMCTRNRSGYAVH